MAQKTKTVAWNLTEKHTHSLNVLGGCCGEAGRGRWRGEGEERGQKGDVVKSCRVQIVYELVSALLI